LLGDGSHGEGSGARLDRPFSESLKDGELIFRQTKHTGNVPLEDFDRVPKLVDSIVFEIFQFDDFGALWATAFPAEYGLIGGDGGEIGEVGDPDDFDGANDAPVVVIVGGGVGADDFDEVGDAGFWGGGEEFLDEEDEVVYVGFIGVGAVTFGVGPMEILLAALAPVGIGPAIGVIDVFDKFQAIKFHDLSLVGHIFPRKRFIIALR
jgi:hypothetical protein